MYKKQLGRPICQQIETMARAVFPCMALNFPTPAARPVFLTVDETAALLRTRRKAVYALIERRQIPGVLRLGRRLLVRSDELLDWLRQKPDS